MTDVAVTWPQSRPLSDYLGELLKAKERGEVVCYRLPTRPNRDLIGGRCWMVWRGAVRGWLRILDVARMADVVNPSSGELMREGWYLVRSPEWYQIDAVPMVGFQSYRYLDGPPCIVG